MVVFSVLVAAHVTFSLSLPRIWLSRSSSKTDALDDDEPPLRFTASQTATTRGVMVLDMMGALDITPMLHFVEPGLKINGEERFKVTDEYIEHYNTVLHGTVEFQPPCSPDPSPLNFFVERAQNTACSASSSCQSCRIAVTFDPRVSQDVERQSLDVRKDGCCWGPQAKGLRGRQWRSFRVAQRWQTASYKTRH